MSVQPRQIKKTIDLFRHFTLILHAFKFFTATKKKKEESVFRMQISRGC